MEYQYEIKIPRERIAVLIGVGGEIKRSIEEATNSKLQVDSQEGDVFITGEDALGLFTAREVVKAIGRGFNPQIATLLLKSDYLFEIVEIQDYSGKSQNDAMRLKGRVIGADGKSRRTIESLTETHISVYGKTIAIIGEIQNVTIAKRAIESLLAGSPHSTVYSWLEKKRRELKMAEFEERAGIRKE